MVSKNNRVFRHDIVPGAPWAYIAVMGVTGAGKSSLIQLVTEDEDVEIGHDLESCTSELKGYTFHLDGYNVSFIDTPGFNDTHKSETEVLQDIAKWLKDSYEVKNKLSGIIYLHSIDKVRMEGSALRNLKMFRELCGRDPLRNVILATTFWGKVDHTEAVKREKQLASTDEFWGDMLEAGSTMKRLTDRDSAFKIVSLLLHKDPMALQIQKELVDQAKDLIDTAAGQTVNEELMRLQKEHKKQIVRMRDEMKELKEHDEKYRKMMAKQQAKVEKELEKVRQQQERLKYDRRVEKRVAANLQSEINDEIAHLKRRLQEEERQRVGEMTFDEAVAFVRANEIKVQADERERVEQQIKKLSKKPEMNAAEGRTGRARRKMKGSGRYLFAALKFIVPITTGALLGVPIPFPFSWPGSGDTGGDAV